jgi:hypothetical protein
MVILSPRLSNFGSGIEKSTDRAISDSSVWNNSNLGAFGLKIRAIAQYISAYARLLFYVSLIHNIGHDNTSFRNKLFPGRRESRVER